MFGRHIAIAAAIFCLCSCCAKPDPSKESMHQAPAVAGAPLLGTHWKLLELNGKPIVPAEDAHEAHLMFHADDNRFSGVGGVNRLMGGFELNGEKLKILPGPSTMMAGPEPLMKQEQEFVQMLMKVKAYRVTGQTLELLDGERVIAKFAVGKAK